MMEVGVRETMTAEFGGIMIALLARRDGGREWIRVTVRSPDAGASGRLAEEIVRLLEKVGRDDTIMDRGVFVYSIGGLPPTGHMHARTMELTIGRGSENGLGETWERATRMLGVMR